MTYPLSPFGPRRPLLTRSVARPLTPTTLPSLTPMSRPQPLLHTGQMLDRSLCTQPQGVSTDLHSTHALCTHLSGSASHALSTLVGHSCLYGVRGPHMSSIESRLWNLGFANESISHERHGSGGRARLSSQWCDNGRPYSYSQTAEASCLRPTRSLPELGMGVRALDSAATSSNCQSSQEWLLPGWRLFSLRTAPKLGCIASKFKSKTALA